MAQLCDLPDECLLLVLSTLGPRELAVVSWTSQRFHGVANDDCLWRPLFQTHASATLVERVTSTNSHNARPHGSVWKEQLRLLTATRVEITLLRNNETEQWMSRFVTHYSRTTFSTSLRQVRTSRLLTQRAVAARSASLGERHVWIVDTPPHGLLVPLRLLHAHGEPAIATCDTVGATWWEIMWVRALAERARRGENNPIVLTVGVALVCFDKITRMRPARLVKVTLPACAQRHNVMPVDPDDMRTVWYSFASDHEVYVSHMPCCDCHLTM